MCVMFLVIFLCVLTFSFDLIFLMYQKCKFCIASDLIHHFTSSNFKDQNLFNEWNRAKNSHVLRKKTFHWLKLTFTNGMSSFLNLCEILHNIFLHDQRNDVDVLNILMSKSLDNEQRNQKSSLKICNLTKTCVQSQQHFHNISFVIIMLRLTLSMFLSIQ